MITAEEYKKWFSGIKRLDLERWQIEEYGDGFKDVGDIKEIHPAFYKNGQYYNRHSKYYWFEINGKAYTRIKEDRMFLYDLTLLNHKYLRKVEMEAIKQLIIGKVCPRELEKRYLIQLELEYLRSIKLDTMLTMNSVRKRWEKMKNDES